METERRMPTSGRGNKQLREPPLNEPVHGVEAAFKSRVSRPIGVPFFVDAMKMTPLPNQDTNALPPDYHRHTHYPNPRRITKKEQQVRHPFCTFHLSTSYLELCCFFRN